MSSRVSRNLAAARRMRATALSLVEATAALVESADALVDAVLMAGVIEAAVIELDRRPSVDGRDAAADIAAAASELLRSRRFAAVRAMCERAIGGQGTPGRAAEAIALLERWLGRNAPAGPADVHEAAAAWTTLLNVCRDLAAAVPAGPRRAHDAAQYRCARIAGVLSRRAERSCAVAAEIGSPPGTSEPLRRARSAARHLVGAADLDASLCVPDRAGPAAAEALRAAQAARARATWMHDAARQVVALLNGAAAHGSVLELVEAIAAGRPGPAESVTPPR